MTAAMDEGIGNVTDALDRLGFSDNLITLFISDNGGPVKLGEYTMHLNVILLTRIHVEQERGAKSDTIRPMQK